LRDRALLAIVVGALLLFLIGMDWGLPWGMSMSIDDVSPWKPLSLPWRWLESWHKYPYLHSFVNLAAYTPYLAWGLATGAVDATCLPSILPTDRCFRDGFHSLSVLMGISRVISALMGAGIVAGAFALARALGVERGGALVAAGFAAVSPVLVVYAHIGNLDIPVTFWFTLSLVAAVRLVDEGGRRRAVLFGVLAAAALSTKDPIIGAYALTGPLLWVAVARRSGRVLPPDLLWLGGSLLVVYAVVQNVVLNPQGFIDHWSFWLPSGEFVSGQREASHGLARFAREMRGDYFAALGTPLGLLAGAGALLACVRRERTAWLLVPAVSYVIFSIVLSRFVAPRFAIPLIPILAVFAGGLAAAAWRMQPMRWVTAPLLIFCLGHGFVYSVHADLLFLDDGRFRAEEWLLANAPAGARVASCSPAVDLPRLDLHGFQPIYVEPGQDCLTALLAAAPDYVLVSSASPRVFRREQPGYVRVFEGRGTRNLSRWFATPFSWLNPEIQVLVPDA
jgi:hypothetical protein